MPTYHLVFSIIPGQHRESDTKAYNPSDKHKRIMEDLHGWSRAFQRGVEKDTVGKEED